MASETVGTDVLVTEREVLKCATSVHHLTTPVAAILLTPASPFPPPHGRAAPADLRHPDGRRWAAADPPDGGIADGVHRL